MARIFRSPQPRGSHRGRCQRRLPEDCVDKASCSHIHGQNSASPLSSGGGGRVDVRLGSSSGNSAPSLVAWASLMSPRCISEEWRVIGAFIALSWPSRLVGCCHRSVWRKPRASSSGTSGCPRPPCQPDLDGAARTVATRMGPEQRITSPCWRVAPSHARKLESVSTTTTTTPTRGL